MSKIIGIDLGTTYSCAAVMQDGQPVVIPNSLGARLTPSAVRILDSGAALVGQHALENRFLDPSGTVTGIKRLIGRRYNEVFDIVRSLPFEVTIDENNLAVVRLRGKTYTPQFLSALILKSLKSDAESYLGTQVSQAVITVPAYFNEIQRYATKEAAQIAGLEVLRLINEPTAACMAYELDKKTNQSVAVFDLGGGTFDVSILESGDGVEEVRSTAGDGFLGGDDFDDRITDWMIEEFLAIHGLDVSSDPVAFERIRSAATAAKHEISQRSEVPVRIPFLASRNGRAIDLELTLTRTLFREICDELFERLALPCRQALSDAGLKPGQLDRVLLVGGATRMPGISDVAQAAFGRPPSRSVNPDEAVALGAGVQAGVLWGTVKDVLLLDVIPASLGLETQAGVMTRIIDRNTTIPTRKSEVFSTQSDNQTSVEIHVLQGERSMAEGNRTLGRLVLREIARAPRGVPEIEVIFEIDANGLLKVIANDRSTGKEVSQTMLPDTGLDTRSLRDLESRIPPVFLG